MRFDAYAATIPAAEFSEVAREMARVVGGQVESGTPRRRYKQVLDVKCGGRLAAWVAWDRGNEVVYVEGKGDTTPDLAGGIRVAYPGHSVPRADVCEDVDEPGAFEQLVGLVREFKGERVYGGFNKLPDDPSLGRTYEAGVRGGVAYLRAYQRGKMPELAALGRPDLARLEGEFRPHYAKDKRAAAAMEPEQFWGLSAWSARVAEAFMRCPIPRYVSAPRDYSTDKTTAYLALTFRRHWQELLSDLGDWECIGREFERIQREHDQAQAAMRRGRPLQ